MSVRIHPTAEVSDKADIGEGTSIWHQAQVREAELELLKYGRHFRLDDKIKIVVGRTRGENQKIVDHHDPVGDMLVKLKSYPGPTALVSRQASPALLEKAAAICAGYSKAPLDQAVDVVVTTSDQKEILRVLPLPPDKVSALLI